MAHTTEAARDHQCEASASEKARARLLSRRGEPLFIADWENVLMLHFAVDAAALQRDVPFQLDLLDGQAFVSLVAFTMAHMRPAFGGQWTAWPLRPMATHDLLNVRTYVRADEEAGIHFLAEWVSNRLAAALGPRTFSLPYRLGHLAYENDWRQGALRGRVRGASEAFSYHADLATGASFAPCIPGSLDEWLMERYTAFNAAGGRRKFFRVWHESWPQCKANAVIMDSSLMKKHWHWFRDAELVGANYSPGVHEVWLGWPHRIRRQ